MIAISYGWFKPDKSMQRTLAYDEYSVHDLLALPSSFFPFFDFTLDDCKSNKNPTVNQSNLTDF